MVCAKKIVQMVKTAAAGDFVTALALTREYLMQVQQERDNAEIIAVCDKLITSLTAAESNARKMIGKLREMKNLFL